MGHDLHPDPVLGHDRRLRGSDRRDPPEGGLSDDSEVAAAEFISRYDGTRIRETQALPT